MIVVGLFSSYLTYIILAAIYALGFSAYMQKCSKELSTTEESKVLHVKDNVFHEKDSVKENSYFYGEDVAVSKAITEKDTRLNKIPVLNLNVKRNFGNKFEFKERLYFRITSRPPPFVA